MLSFDQSTLFSKHDFCFETAYIVIIIDRTSKSSKSEIDFVLNIVHWYKFEYLIHHYKFDLGVRGIIKNERQGNARFDLYFYPPCRIYRGRKSVSQCVICFSFGKIECKMKIMRNCRQWDFRSIFFLHKKLKTAIPQHCTKNSLKIEQEFTLYCGLILQFNWLLIQIEKWRIYV